VQSETEYYGIAGPQSGSYYLQLTARDTASVRLTEQLPNIKAGMSVSCGGYYNYPADIDGASIAVQVTLDGMPCGGSPAAVYYTEEGWASLTRGTVLAARDNPTYTVEVFFYDRPFRAGMGLDGLFVVASGQLGLPTCTSAAPPAPTVD
jgi:hypothetical protein